ncbi:regulator of actin cytoskelton capa [Volvox carteri f. nagariensis]|uniref:Regulator of actin cytoskelton capa n=1 Tax=Volvox carteri f. nagariensis TaxID=3068 RepID=D8TLU8_VOLCA|nr:regulator of actin cytoskelton capa [Volvox carteri f. nagariensis]EFJ51526.1 regulator of actin cytoskelton capa [Volvox carteri f. nagariensis]|eukprot:XP_002947478.1 regulator of actin cytoskelton capa [Volvox carteri f. nagariensis]
MQSFEEAFQGTGRVLEVAAVAKKPDDAAELQRLLAPVAEAMGAVTAAAEGRVTCPNHLKVLSEAVGALGFLAYTGHGCGISPPRQHVADSWQSAEFYSNKLLMEFRGKDDNQVAWVRALKVLIQQLEQFVVRHCPTGLRFDPNGVPVATAMRGGGGGGGAVTPAAAAPAAVTAAVTAPSKPAVRAPPPPPPGPPPKPLSPEELAAAADTGGGEGGNMSALFKELSKGEGVTAGLRRVTADMKTKHNTDKTGKVPATSASASACTAAAAAAAGSGTAPAAGTKWVVENFSGRQDLLVENNAPKNSVYVYGCTDCVVQVQGKVNAITLDNCRRVGVVFGNVISSAEAVNCNSVQLQTTGTVPTISVEKTDEAQLFLSQQASGAYHRAKCSSINVVVVPAEGDSSDPHEHAVPEQFISTFQGGKLITVSWLGSGWEGVLKRGEREGCDAGPGAYGLSE